MSILDSEIPWRRMFRTWRLRRKAKDGDVWHVYERGKHQVRLVADRLHMGETGYDEGVKALAAWLGI